MPHPYTEDQLVEQPALGLFGELGWTTVSALEEVFGDSGMLGRETPSNSPSASDHARSFGAATGVGSTRV